MKKVSFLVFVAIMLLLAGIFSACNEGKDNTDANETDALSFSIKETQESRYEFNEGREYVSMRITPGSGSIDSPVTLVLENHTKENSVLTYGKYLSFKYLEKEYWMKIESDFVFDHEGEIMPGGKEELVFNLSLLKEKNDGKKGIYKVCKMIKVTTSNPDNGMVLEVVTMLSVDFEIK